MTSWLHANGSPLAHPRSYYADITPELVQFPMFKGQHAADVCIVGGGITGLSAALHAAHAGKSVILLEAARIGWGASGRNGGQVGSGFNWDMQKLEAKLGEATAAQLWTLTEDAKSLTKSLIADHAPEADFRPGILHACGSEADLRHAQDAAFAMRDRYGHATDVIEAEAMRGVIGSDAYAGGTLDLTAGYCNPLAYVRGLARACAQAGVHIHEGSEVHRLTAGQVQTNAGAVRAKHILHATNGLGTHLTRPTAARVLPINNYIAVTEPLGALAPMGQPVAVTDSRFVVNYFWQTADGRLVYGGGESYGKSYPADITAKVRRNLARVYPHLEDVTFTHAWGGTLAVTATRLPYVGHQGAGVYAAGGYSGHGLALAGLAGKAVAEAMDGDSKRLQLLAQLPTPALPGGRMFGGLMTTGGMAVAALMDRLKG